MLRTGFVQLGQWRGVPIRVHWSTPLGALLAAGFRFEPAVWLGFFFLVLFHELGHAFVVRRAGAHVHSVQVMAVGGLCLWSGTVTPLPRVHRLGWNLGSAGAPAAGPIGLRAGRTVPESLRWLP